MSKRLYIISFLFVLELQLIRLKHIQALANAHNFNNSSGFYTTSVERIANFSNGCYKQRIIEPDLWNSKRFFETEQLVCPPTVNFSTFTTFTQQLQLNASATNHTTHFLPANNTANPILPPTRGFVPANNFINVPANATYVSHVASTNTYPVALMPPPAVSQPSYATNPTLNHQPSYVPLSVASNNTSHTAAILSKKSGFFGHGKKTSSAKTLNSFNGFFMFMVIKVVFKL